MTIVENPFEKVRVKLVSARIEFMSQLAKFSNEELMKQFTDEEWSPLQLAHHLYIADGVAMEQMQQIQNEDNPLLTDTGVIVPQLTRKAELPVSLESVLAGMAARREAIFAYLSALPAESWMRPAQHSAWGPIKFYQFVNVLPQHDQQHARQLSSIKARFQEHNV
ncbi:MAG: DinB family protein [Ktedonobacteraceae bacterium]|nr:DinB family protein [Ktedonobacteraceae bacterium]